eukprot:GFKZ01012827.1.p1 GENE.GFKZ01012827.1~~GFKZ01012827.1.p1  ORF type:complete len:172 (-),score=18.75 GFKZ01012827.1:881-1396(-)
MTPFTPAEVLSLLGLTLMVCGALAFNESGLQKSAISAIYVGNGGAVVCFMLAAGCRDTTLKKGDSGYKIMMICVHLAIVWPIILGSAVGWRLWLAWNNPAKAYLKLYFGIIVAACVLTTAAMVALKPKKKEEGAPAKQEDAAAEVTGFATTTARATKESLTKRKPGKVTAE